MFKCNVYDLSQEVRKLQCLPFGSFAPRDNQECFPFECNSNDSHLLRRPGILSQWLDTPKGVVELILEGRHVSVTLTNFNSVLLLLAPAKEQFSIICFLQWSGKKTWKIKPSERSTSINSSAVSLQSYGQDCFSMGHFWIISKGFRREMKHGFYLHDEL